MNIEIKKRLIPLAITAALSLFVFLPLIVWAQASIPQGGTGNRAFPNNVLLATDQASFQRIQATSSDPLYVGSIFGTTTSESTLTGLLNLTNGFISSASSTVNAIFNVEEHFSASSTISIAATSTFDGRMGIGTSSMGISAGLYIEIAELSDHGLIIQGTLNQDRHDFMVLDSVGNRLFNISNSGETEIFHTAGEVGDHSLHLETQVGGLGGVVGFFNDFDLGDLADGEDASVGLWTIDRVSSTGGSAHGLTILTTNVGDADVHALEVGPQVSPILQASGTFGDMDECTSTAGGDILAACTSASTDVTLFASNTDEFVVGDAAQFTAIDVELATESNKSIEPTFEFSTGNDTWTTFAPTDGTDGFQDTSQITWELADIPTWATGTSTRYFIRITRNRTGNIATLPVENLIQISATTPFAWDLDGNITGNTFLASSTILTDGTLIILGSGTSTFSGGLEAEGIYARLFSMSPLFIATSTTATSTFGWGIQANALDVLSVTATSTFAHGIDIATGCFSIAGTCVGGGGGGGAWTSASDETTMDTPADALLIGTTTNPGAGSTAIASTSLYSFAGVEANGTAPIFNFDRYNSGHVILTGNADIQFVGGSPGQNVSTNICQDSGGDNDITTWDPDILWENNATSSINLDGDTCTLYSFYIAMGTTSQVFIFTGSTQTP